MTIALVKVSSVNNRMIPLGLAALQAYLKSNQKSVHVYNFRPDTYLLPKVFTDPLIQDIPPNFIMNHQDFPILLSLIESTREEKELSFNSSIFGDLFQDFAFRLREKSPTTKKRFDAMIAYSRKRIIPNLLDAYNTVAFSLDYQNISDTTIASLLLKLHDPSIRIIWGGATITQSSEAFKMFLEEKIVDGLVIGEGESPILSIARGEHLKHIKGVMSSNHNNKILYRKQSQLDINSLPSPDYTDLPLDTYFNVGSVYRSRGCTNRCKFCAEWSLFGPRFRVRSIKNTIQDIEAVLDVASPDYMIFGESLVNDNNEYFLKLCKAMEEKSFGIPFGSHFRAQFTPELASSMQKAGFNDAWVGFEAFTDEELSKMNKGVNSSQNLNTIKHLSETGVNILAMLVVGFSNMEDELKNCETIVKTIENLSNERIDGKPLSIQFRPAPMFLVPGSFDYNAKRTSHTKPWESMSISPENRKKIALLENKLSHIPYEFRRPIPDASVGDLLRKIKEADRNAGFVIGGLAKHCINFMVQERKNERINRKLEKFGIVTQRAQVQ